MEGVSVVLMLLMAAALLITTACALAYQWGYRRGMDDQRQNHTDILNDMVADGSLVVLTEPAPPCTSCGYPYAAHPWRSCLEWDGGR
jgi:nitrogen fixation-related uncharacterized protein